MRLDGTSFDSTLDSLASLLRIDPSDVMRALDGLRIDDWANGLDTVLKDMAGDLAWEGAEAVFFHMTRTMNRESFKREGLRPRHEVLDQIWRDLEALASEQDSPISWEDLREELESGKGKVGARYQARADPSLEGGPFGVLLREPTLSSLSPSTHYFRMPETVQDILEAAEARYDCDLRNAYSVTAEPVIVAFVAQPESGGIAMRDCLYCALVYLWCSRASLEHQEPDFPELVFSSPGKRVPSEEILRVESRPRSQDW